jgi:hypothetical protein
MTDERIADLERKLAEAEARLWVAAKLLDIDRESFVLSGPAYAVRQAERERDVLTADTDGTTLTRMLDEARREGAEAMREAAATRCTARAAFLAAHRVVGEEPLMVTADDIRALPLPGDKEPT